MSSLSIFYWCLLIPSLLYFLITLFSETDADADTFSTLDTPDDLTPSDWRFSLSSLCYFLIGFSAAGLLFANFGVLASVTAGLVTGFICAFTLKYIFQYIIRFCFSNEVGIPEPEVGDECITLNNISPHDVGLVRIFKRVGTDNHLDKTLTYFAVSSDGEIENNVSCVVTKVDGNRVVVESTSADSAVNP